MSLELKAILSYSYGNYGDDPSKTSFSSHATLLNHFKNGAIFPKGGPDTLVNGFVDHLSKNGAQIYYGVTIDKIVVVENKVVGINGYYGRKNKPFYLKTDKVLSTIGVHQTNKMVDLVYSIQKPFLPSHSVCHLSFFVKLSKNVVNYSGNVWYFPDINHVKNSKAYENDPENKDFPAVFISFPNNKNGSKEPTVHMIAQVPLDIKDSKMSIEQNKKHLTEKFLKILYQEFPETKGVVETTDLATPYSSKKYLGTFYSYGLTSSPIDIKTNTCVREQV